MGYLQDLYKIFRGTTANDQTGSKARDAGAGLNENTDRINNALEAIDNAAEKNANKATGWSVINDVLFPSVKAVKTELDKLLPRGTNTTDTAQSLRDDIDVNSNKRITGLSITGSSTKTVTITLADGTTVTGSFVDDGGSGGGTSDGNDYVSGGSFNPATGTATLTRTDGGTVQFTGFVTDAEKSTWNGKADNFSATENQYSTHPAFSNSNEAIIWLLENSRTSNLTKLNTPSNFSAIGGDGQINLSWTDTNS